MTSKVPTTYASNQKATPTKTPGLLWGQLQSASTDSKLTPSKTKADAEKSPILEAEYESRLTNRPMRSLV